MADDGTAGGAVGTAGQVHAGQGVVPANTAGAGYHARSLWQTYSEGLRGIFPASWLVMRAGSVGWERCSRLVGKPILKNFLKNHQHIGWLIAEKAVSHRMPMFPEECNRSNRWKPEHSNRHLTISWSARTNRIGHWYFIAICDYRKIGNYKLYHLGQEQRTSSGCLQARTAGDGPSSLNWELSDI